MKQKLFEIKMQRDIHRRQDMSIGILTSIEINVLRNGKKLPYRHYSSYKTEKTQQSTQITGFRERGAA